MTAKGLLPPDGLDRRRLGQGTRVEEEVVAGGAISTILPGSSLFALSLCSWAADSLGSGLPFNRLQKCSRTRRFPQSSSICAVPQDSLGRDVLCWSLCQTQYPQYKNNIWV